MTWAACWRLWGEKFALTCDLVWKEGRLDLRNLNVLKGALSEMGSAHKACGFVVTLWAHTTCEELRGNGVPCPHSVLSGVRGGINR